MSIYRGDVYYIDKGTSYGSEQRADRPAIIVSNNMNNQNSDCVEVVYLTTQPKTDLPTHVTIRSTKRISTALCEQIASVSTDRIMNFICHVTDDELDMIDAALAISIGLNIGAKKAESANGGVMSSMKTELDSLRAENQKLLGKISELESCVQAARIEADDVSRESIRTQAKCEVFMELYSNAVERLCSRKA